MRKSISVLAMAAIVALGLSACSSGGEKPADSPATTTDAATAEAPPAEEATTDAPPADVPEGETITMWVVGSDTQQSMRDYLAETFAAQHPGATLKIEEIGWGDIISKLTTNMPDPANTPDVVEIGNTQSPTFTNVGAFLDISDMYAELGGDKLLQSFVEVGKVNGKNFTLPYYFGSRYMFYRTDVWAAAGLAAPKTLDEFNESVVKLTEANPSNVADFSGFYIGGQDWRNGISWVFANGGELAKQGETGQWVSTLSDPNTIKGLEQLQKLYQGASKAPADARDQSPWVYVNDTDAVTDGDATIETTMAAGTIMAPSWAHWSIGDLDGDARVWNDDKFGVFALPGNDGKPAPVFAGGSNIGISATSQHVDLAKDVLRIVFSPEYQTMLGENGLGPANQDYVSSLGSDIFAEALIASASNSKLTPAAPGWAAVEGAGVLEEFFSKIAQGGNVTELAAQYDDEITQMLNG